MVTILLEQIIEILKGWLSSFTSWAEDTAEKLGLIEEATEYIDDISDNTDIIAENTLATKNDTGIMRITLNNANARLAQIYSDTSTIKNNVGSISTSAGTAAAFAEDCATNTLNMDNRLVTIGSDTTQIRTDSTRLAADVAEIKDTLGLYLYNTIVTEDAEGSIASCDTDLKDYLQEAKVTIPADAGGITGIAISQYGANLWDEQWELGSYNSTGQPTPSTSIIRTKNYIPCKANLTYFAKVPAGTAMVIFFYDSSYTYISDVTKTNQTFTAPANAAYMHFRMSTQYGTTYNNDLSISYPSTYNLYSPYVYNSYAVTFTSITDGAEIDLLTGLIKINTSPVTYDSITPIAIRTYKGINNIYSDIGTTSITYRETLKHYLKKQEA